MQAQADKTPENKSRSNAHSSKTEEGGEVSYAFVDRRGEAVAQRKLQQVANNSAQVQKVAQMQALASANRTGLPDGLKAGIENLSGYAMDDVRVHYGSDKPAQLNAHAYAQGSDIHVAPGQERHLPHEAWHVVQQKQGRVKPTTQLKGKVAVNDDAGLEKEADVMGGRALQMKAFGQTLQQQNGYRSAEPVAQRVIRIGKTYSFISAVEGLPKPLSGVAEALRPLLEDRYVYQFETADEVALVAGCEQIAAIIHSRSFQNFAVQNTSFLLQLKGWLTAELNELKATTGDEVTVGRADGFLAMVVAGADFAAIIPVAGNVYDFLLDTHKDMFSLDENRQNKVNDGNGYLEERIYGYHLTKIHNIPGIMAKGLDPGEGAKEKGSLAMSTKEQQQGSAKTSKGVVAFGLQPSTFRPYINQYEDRRQMIESTPQGLKPIMLRFVISAQVRKKSNADYMQASAINTTEAILPGDIEVLTGEGWVAIRKWTEENTIHQMRSGDDDARSENEWGKVDTAIFDWAQMTGKIGINLLGFARANWEGEEGPTDEQLFESVRDQEIAKVRGIAYTFRGATMQTSGRKETWQYAFNVVPDKGTKVDKWLQECIRDYQTGYKGLAEKQLSGAKGGDAPKEPKVRGITLEQLTERLIVGEAEGNELNCLLETVDQLSNNVRASSPERVEAMRQVLVGFGYAPAQGMIDIYGGAGMQLANDLNLRIQVIQQQGGQYIPHPIMGQGGRLVYILHTPGHFQPLWIRPQGGG